MQVLLDGQAQVDKFCGVGAGDQLLHVEHCGGVEHSAAVCHSNHGEGIVHAECGQAGTVDGVNRHVEGGTGAVADFLAVVQHGSLVLLAFTDDNGAVEVDGGEAVTHCVYGCAICEILFACADPGACSNCCCFSRADQFHSERVCVRVDFKVSRCGKSVRASSLFMHLFVLLGTGRCAELAIFCIFKAYLR